MQKQLNVRKIKTNYRKLTTIRTFQPNVQNQKYKLFINEKHTKTKTTKRKNLL